MDFICEHAPVYVVYQPCMHVFYVFVGSIHAYSPLFNKLMHVDIHNFVCVPYTHIFDGHKHLLGHMFMDMCMNEYVIVASQIP
jgi:hypothetical protein